MAVFLEKLLFVQAQVVPITQEHKANFLGCVCECSLSSGPLFHCCWAAVLSVKISLWL